MMSCWSYSRWWVSAKVLYCPRASCPPPLFSGLASQGTAGSRETGICSQPSSVRGAVCFENYSQSPFGTSALQVTWMCVRRNSSQALSASSLGLLLCCSVLHQQNKAQSVFSKNARKFSLIVICLTGWNRFTLKANLKHLDLSDQCS